VREREREREKGGKKVTEIVFQNKNYTQNVKMKSGKEWGQWGNGLIFLFFFYFFFFFFHFTLVRTINNSKNKLYKFKTFNYSFLFLKKNGYNYT